MCVRVRRCGFPAAPAGSVARLVRSLSVSAVNLRLCLVGFFALQPKRRSRVCVLW